MTKSGALVTQSYSFARHIVSFYKLLERQREYTLGKQILSSGTSIGANLAEAVHAQSRADFISKFSIALKEASETDFWLRLFADSSICAQEAMMLRQELSDIIGMLTSSLKTLRQTIQKTERIKTP